MLNSNSATQNSIAPFPPFAPKLFSKTPVSPVNSAILVVIFLKPDRPGGPVFSLVQTTSRQGEILEVVFRNGWDYMKSLLTGSKTDAPSLPTPAVLRNILVELGPVYIKLGCGDSNSSSLFYRFRSGISGGILRDFESETILFNRSFFGRMGGDKLCSNSDPVRGLNLLAPEGVTLSQHKNSRNLAKLLVSQPLFIGCY
jgi:hypothetical protein